MNDDIFLMLFGIVVFIFLGYAALQGIIAQQFGDKKLSKEVMNIRKEFNEFRKEYSEDAKQNGTEKQEVA